MPPHASPLFHVHASLSQGVQSARLAEGSCAMCRFEVRDINHFFMIILPFALTRPPRELLHASDADGLSIVSPLE